MDPVKAKANYSRLCQLLVDKGGDALRSALHAIHPPSTLPAVLNANKKTLNRLKFKVITPSQWDLLFPVSGTPDSNNFDVTLLTILLRNICGLRSPPTGWNVMPPGSDTSTSANIARIKIFRNEVYGHIARAHMDDIEFERLWKEISTALINLGIPQQDIDILKIAPLSPEEESYIEELKEWNEREDVILSKLLNIENKLRRIDEKSVPSQVNQLSKFDFTGKIDDLCEKFQDGTREWFLDKLSSWFHDEKSRVLILTAGPGVGKSVLAANVCELYKQRDDLAANHFCDVKYSDSRNPKRILQSLARQMSENVDGFRDKLTEVLCREHSDDSLPDAFRVLLHDPLHALNRDDPMLIVVDALDETKTDVKSDFLQLIAEEFSRLPKWIKIFITSRPELQVQKKLQLLNPVEILPDNHHHQVDLKHFIHHCLPKLSEGNVRLLVSKCEGSFLYAYYIVDELKKMDLGFEPELSDYVPSGISGFYEKQFKRLKADLQRTKLDASIFNSFVNVVAASREPLPMKILFECVGVSTEDYEVRKTIIGIMSEILPVYEDCLSVYHKSLFDWLILDGYEEHEFAANVEDGNERIWYACKSIYSVISSLESDFQISPEKRYALANGEKYMLAVGKTEDFHWLVNVRLNCIKFEFCGANMDADFDTILRCYISNLVDPIFSRIVQLHAFFNAILRSSYSIKKKNKYAYLQSLANGHFDVLNNTNNKKEARAILDTTKEFWMEHVGNEYNSNFKVDSYVIFDQLVNDDDMYDHCIVSSEDNKLLATCRLDEKVKVFVLPSLSKLFELETENIGCLVFSPDSSYLLGSSVRTCISIEDQKEVAFIPQGPKDFLCCSFSSCGKKLVTFERNCAIKVWDVRNKVILVEGQSVIQASLCWFAKCDSHILAAKSKPYFPKSYSPADFALFDSATLARKSVENICNNTCLTDEDDCRMLSPLSEEKEYTSPIKIDHFHFPSAEKLLISNRYCSKPFQWKNRKCVIFSNSTEHASPLVVYDFINKEIIDVFHINCIPNQCQIEYISNLDATNFLICFQYGHAFVLSFESSSESSRASSVENADIECCALSPYNSYIACCYNNSTLTIRSVDNGETVQTVKLKQPPKACWWSKLNLWVVCEGVVEKYPYDCRKILGNELEERAINFDVVLKFAEGTLVIKYDGKISIFKICNEMLCPQQIPILFPHDKSAVISSDGCAVLLYDASYYQLCEIACENMWELRYTGRFDGEVKWLFLTGTKNSRCSFFFPKRNRRYLSGPEDIYLSVIDDFSNRTQRTIRRLPVNLDLSIQVIYVDSNTCIIYDRSWIHFVKVSDGEIITSLFVGSTLIFKNHASSIYIASRGLLLLVGDTDIEYFKIHNVENLSLELERSSI